MTRIHQITPARIVGAGHLPGSLDLGRRDDDPGVGTARRLAVALEVPLATLAARAEQLESGVYREFVRKTGIRSRDDGAARYRIAWKGALWRLGSTRSDRLVW